MAELLRCLRCGTEWMRPAAGTPAPAPSCLACGGPLAPLEPGEDGADGHGPAGFDDPRSG